MPLTGFKVFFNFLSLVAEYFLKILGTRAAIKPLWSKNCLGSIFSKDLLPRVEARPPPLFFSDLYISASLLIYFDLCCSFKRSLSSSKNLTNISTYICLSQGIMLSNSDKLYLWCCIIAKFVW